MLCLVSRQSPNNLFHLLVRVDSETLLLGYTGQLHVLAVQLLLHNLLQRLQNKNFGFGEGKGLVEFILELGLGAFGTGADGFGVVAVEGT